MFQNGAKYSNRSALPGPFYTETFIFGSDTHLSASAAALLALTLFLFYHWQVHQRASASLSQAVLQQLDKKLGGHMHNFATKKGLLLF